MADPDEKQKERTATEQAAARRESGAPGGGQGHQDEIGGSGVYPMSGPHPSGEAALRGQLSWGQGERGAAGYEDHGESELHFLPSQAGEGKAGEGQVLGGYDPTVAPEQTLELNIPVADPNQDLHMNAILRVPEQPLGIVLFAHGSGSGRLSPRNQFVAHQLHQAGLATLLLDLLTEQEEIRDARTAELRFDIALLGSRLQAATRYVQAESHLKQLKIGYFGASTGAAATLVAAAANPGAISAIVSRGGRPDLAGPALDIVQTPTLLIVGSADVEVLRLNRDAQARLGGETQLATVPGTTHLFEEPGALDEVARLARLWFGRHLAGGRAIERRAA